MSSITDISFNIADTQQTFKGLEDMLRQFPGDKTLLMSLESVQKRQEKLETAFMKTAGEEAIDVCSYRIFAATGERYPIYALGSALRNFQRWYTGLYDAIRHGPKERTKSSADIVALSRLDFAFTYSGSVGIAMTLPTERLLIENELETAMKKMLEMLAAESSDQIHTYAKEYGSGVIRAMSEWVNDHVSAGLGAEIAWHKGPEPICDFLASEGHLRNLARSIAEVSDTEETEFEVIGTLVGADTSRHTFHMTFDQAEEIRGSMAKEIGEQYAVKLPKRYTAKIRRTAYRNFAMDKEIIQHFLLALNEPNAPAV